MKNTVRSTLLSVLLGSMIIQGTAICADEARVEFPVGNAPVFGWQRTPMAEPKGGEKFATSAFVHPLATPSGFVCVV